MAYNGQQALQEALKKAAEEKVKYDNNLVGKVFAYAYVDPKINQVTFKEVEFKTENFLHLTGLDYFDVQYKKRVLKIDMPTRADEFYERLGKDSTLIQDVSFIKGSTPTETADNIKTAQRKLRNLSQLVNIAKKAEYIGRYKDPNKFDLLVNRSVESLALNKDGEVYIPISSRYGNVDKHIDLKDKNMIFAIFSKENNERDFKLVYLNKGVNNLDKSVFDSQFLPKLSLASFENENVEFNKKALSTVRHRFIISSVKSQIVSLAQKRAYAYDSETALNEYTKSRDNFIDHLKTYNEIESDEKREEIIKVISAHYKEQLSKADILDNVDLIPKEEIDKINEVYSKYPNLNLSVNLGDEAFGEAASIANAIKAPTADLLKNKTTNFFLLPKRKEIDFHGTSLHIPQLQGGEAVLKMPPQLPFNEIIENLIAQLSESAQKISDFLSTPIRFSAQKQPPQAHTAHERKINSELPFPKQKPSEERAEPITAKPKKRNVKSAEKQSSWIGKLLSLAKSEADEHNKNHEPKSHDKDKSL